MNYLWAFMILTGIIYGAFHGTLPQITTAALDSAKEAVTLCITMMGVMSFWVGLMKIAEKTGIIAGLSMRLAPVLHFLFPDIPKDHPAKAVPPNTPHSTNLSGISLSRLVSNNNRLSDPASIAGSIPRDSHIELTDLGTIFHPLRNSKDFSVDHNIATTCCRPI